MDEKNQNLSRIIPVDLGGEMKKSFISYAMAVIINGKEAWKWKALQKHRETQPKPSLSKI